MSLKSPSKYYSLSYLLLIKENNYYLNYDFQPEEVDVLIWQKQQKLLPKPRINIADITSKLCTSCKKVKDLAEFDRDASKVLKKRSHCKKCRKRVPF